MGVAAGKLGLYCLLPGDEPPTSQHLARQSVDFKIAEFFLERSILPSQKIKTPL